jgi:hypothetical protein
MIKLIDLLKEYKNQGPTTPEVYILDTKNGEVIPSSMDEVQKISNLSYDMGGGESSFYDEYNIVIIDNMDENKVLNGILNTSNAEKKLYIKYNLEVPFSFPQANKIIASQIVYHLKNVEGFAQTINDSLKSNGEIEFNSDIVTSNDKKFIKSLKELGFYTHDFKEQNNGGVLSLKKSKPNTLIITPFDKEYKKPKENYSFQGYDGEIHNFKTYKELKSYFITYVEKLFNKYPYFYTKNFLFGKETGKWDKHQLKDYNPWSETYGNSLEVLEFDMKAAYDENKKPLTIFRNFKISHELTK